MLLLQHGDSKPSTGRETGTAKKKLRPVHKIKEVSLNTSRVAIPHPEKEPKPLTLVAGKLKNESYII